MTDTELVAAIIRTFGTPAAEPHKAEARNRGWAGVRLPSGAVIGVGNNRKQEVK